MTDETKWLAYYPVYRGKRENVSSIVRRSTERKPYGAGWSVRDATAEEIATAIVKETEARASAAQYQAFIDRREFKAADRIRSILDWMKPDDHPLDRLTADEWEALVERLTTK